MSTVMTLDELDSIPVGTTLTVEAGAGRQTWTRSTMGLEMDGSVVETRWFDGAIAAGSVRMGVSFVVDTWWTAGTDSTYYVYSLTDDGCKVVHIYNDFSVGFEQLTEVRAGLTFAGSTVPERVARMEYMIRLLASRDMELGRSAEGLVHANSRISELERRDAGINRTNLNYELNGIIEEFDDRDDVDRLVSVMRRYDMSPPSRNISFTIAVEGTTRVTIESSQLMSHLSGVNPSDDVEVEVPWTTEILWDGDYDGDNSDPCEDRDFINDTWVRERLDEMGQPYEEFEITSRGCDGC